MEMAQGLLHVSTDQQMDKNRRTYKKPRQKTAMSMIFCRCGSCRDLSTGIGIVRIVKSLTRLTPAMMYQIVAGSIHLPLMLLSQKAATGWQMRVSRKASATAHADRKQRPKRIMR